MTLPSRLLGSGGGDGLEVLGMSGVERHRGFLGHLGRCSQTGQHQHLGTVLGVPHMCCAVERGTTTDRGRCALRSTSPITPITVNASSPMKTAG